MNRDNLMRRLTGCYVTVPTMFRDSDLELNLHAMHQHVQFLIEGGIQEGSGVILAGGAAGDFSAMTVSERLRVTETVISAANSRVAVAMGAQTSSTRELVELAHGAQKLGATYIQVSPPFYFSHTEGDFLEYVAAAANAAPEVGIIVYNTYWTSSGVSSNLVDQLLELPNVVGLKWSTPDKGNMEFEAVVARFSQRIAVIDNQNRFVSSHILGGSSIELHICNHWPSWGVYLWNLLQAHKYQEAQTEMIRVVLPYMELWSEIERFTSGDGYMDKLCMELVGLASSRCRPPTRDIRDAFRDKARKMLLDCGTPNVVFR